MTLLRLASRASRPRSDAGQQRHVVYMCRYLTGCRTLWVAPKFRGPTNRPTSSEPDPRRPVSADGVLSAAPRPPHRLSACCPLAYSTAAVAILRPTLQTTSASRHRSLVASSTRSFSGSAPARAMTATKIDGTAVAKKIRERLRAEIAQVKEINPRFQPSLKIIQGSWTRIAPAALNTGRFEFCVTDSGAP